MPPRGDHAHFLSGDTLFLYTDGVTERSNRTSDQWGDERLLTTITETMIVFKRMEKNSGLDSLDVTDAERRRVPVVPLAKNGLGDATIAENADALLDSFGE
jgi:hypothetical protein